MKLPEILYEDENIFVFNKPAGLVVHGDGKSTEVTLSDILIENFPEMKNVGESVEIKNQKPKIKKEETIKEDDNEDIDSDKDIPVVELEDGYNIIKIYRPGIVHRLDRETSGCLIVAKNQNTYEFLKNEFINHNVKKTYHTFVYGAVKNDSEIIDAPIGRSGKDVRKWATSRGARGVLRDAKTKYQVLARIGLEEGASKGSTQEGTYSYIEVKPETGRTHQIRVHMKHINHPIVCDNLYAPNKEPALGFQRLALHAHKVSFKNLKTGEVENIEAPFPEDFINARKLAGI
jgi:RluA family pseudouridine synthase